MAAYWEGDFSPHDTCSLILILNHNPNLNKNPDPNPNSAVTVNRLKVKESQVKSLDVDCSVPSRGPDTHYRLDFTLYAEI